MDNIQYEGLLGIMSEMNKKIDVIQANSKVKEFLCIWKIQRKKGSEIAFNSFY